LGHSVFVYKDCNLMKIWRNFFVCCHYKLSLM